jgi:hypothetical protein
MEQVLARIDEDRRARLIELLFQPRRPWGHSNGDSFLAIPRTPGPFRSYE